MEKPLRIPVGDLDPKDTLDLRRFLEDDSRHHGRMVECVLQVLGRGAEPTPIELAAALREAADAQATGKPIPRELLDYSAKVLDGPSRKPGPRTAPRTPWGDAQIVVYYYAKLATAIDAHDADESQTRAVKTRAKKQTATRFGCSVGTVNNVLAARPVFKFLPK